jgi:hypothetical protein
MLDVFDGLPGISLVPMSVESFCREAELNDEVVGMVLRLELAAFFAAEARPL